jgi:hypothetical protein
MQPMSRRFSVAVADNPAMLVLWDADANTGIDPARTGARSSHSKAWRCPIADDHRWIAAPAAITRSLEKGFTGCPACAGRQLSMTNSFAARYPEGVHLWHPDRNGHLTPDQVLGGSPDPLWWKCPEGPDHEWQVSPLILGSHSLANGRRGCPYCAGKRPSVTNSVAAHPQLAAEWHPNANGDVRAEQVVASTAAKLWWRCVENPEHEWQATGANRTRGRSCPMCTKHLRSVLEVCLAYELSEFLPALNLADDKVVIDGVIRHVDLLLREPRIVVEIDGRYRHDGQVELTRDAAKTRLLEAAGYRVIRLREMPLREVGTHDIVCPTDATVKQAADAILRRLLELAWVPLDLGAVTAYLAEPEPRRVEQALVHLRAERPGKSIRLPGPASFTRQDRWEEGLRLLASFAAREGHANVPWEQLEDGFPLGKWVGAKRAQHRRGSMTRQRAARLEAVPGWIWDAVEEQWENGYQSLLQFQQREGHLRVPAHYWDDDGFPLGSWVRSHRRRGGRRSITPEQQQRLDALPGWTYAPPTETAWEAALAALKVFAEREGHCRTPRQYREGGINIDSWSKQQRARYHAGALPADRKHRREAIPGWSWRPQDDAWEAGFAALTAYVSDTGSAAVRRDETVDGYPLGAWVGEQRARRTAGDLPPERRHRMEEVPGWEWNPHAESWERHFTTLLEFVAREGHARVPTDHVENGLPLAAWVIRHRQEHKAGKVPADRVQRLEGLPGWAWDVLAARWEDHFAALEAFVAREGHARVPTTHHEGPVRLGPWVIAQRQSNRKEELGPERSARLSDVPGWVWDTRDAAWEAGFNALLRFHARTGHCDVPGTWLEDGYRLGQWLTVQRGLIRSGKVKDDRRERLGQLASWRPAPGSGAL